MLKLPSIFIYNIAYLSRSVKRFDKLILICYNDTNKKGVDIMFSLLAIIASRESFYKNKNTAANKRWIRDCNRYAWHR